MIDQPPRWGGGPPASPLLLKAADLTDDGHWHLLEPILRKLMPLIPPGEALRRNESERRMQHGPAERSRPADLDRLIRSGKRSKAREVFTTQSFEIEKRDGDHYVRMVRMPVSVIRERTRVRSHRIFTPSSVADELARSDTDIKLILAELTYRQLLEVSVEMAHRLQRSRNDDERRDLARKFLGTKQQR